MEDWVKKARFARPFRNNVRCELCPHYCFLKPGETGKCRVRENRDGVLVSLVYAKPCSLAVDPIEKKPLYHFYPGQKTLSLATVGCNLNCKYCQNFEISQAKPEQGGIIKKPKEIVKEAEKNSCNIISYTYTEPTVFYEYVEETAVLAKEKGMKNVIVSNGFINQEPLRELCRFLDACNIDLKAIDDRFYDDICGGRIEPVLKAIKVMKEERIWMELTNLIVPELNDSEDSIRKLVVWVKENLGTNIPLHFSAFYPCFNLAALHSTPREKLILARKIAKEEGLNYVYIGNVRDGEGNNTYCPNCSKLLVERRMFHVLENKIQGGKCVSCGEKIAGIW